MTPYDAPDLTAAGIDYFVRDAGRLGLETKFLTGTVVNGIDPENITIIFDGDNVPLNVRSTIGILPTGAQASVLSIGDKGLFIIGSQVKALSEYALPPPTGGNNSGTGGGGGSSNPPPAQGPGSTAPFTTLFLQDNFNRTGSTWGDPDLGPSYVQGSGGSGGGTLTMPVTPGFGTFSFVGNPILSPAIVIGQQTLGPGNGFNPVFLRNHSRWVKNIQATTTATAGLRLRFRFDIFNGSVGITGYPSLRFYGDGTTTAQIIGQGTSSSSEVAVPGVSAHEPVDVYAEWRQTQVLMWAALTSTGVDPDGAPLITLSPTFGSQVMIAAGRLLYVFEVQDRRENSSLTVSEISMNMIDW